VGRRNRTRVQVVIEILPGSELWLKVEHVDGWFRVPSWVEAGVIVEGALARWQTKAPKRRPGEASVAVPLSEFLEHYADTRGAPEPKRAPRRSVAPLRPYGDVSR
jgi:hypothetical protein